MNIKPSKYNYKHGPLARTVLGQNLVQGIDYAYTLQGWLKGINSTGVGDGSFDMGQDGKTGSVNDNIARDVFGISLYYFTNDYKASGRNISGFAEPFASVDVSNDLFNGNIKAQVVSIPKLGDAMVYSYKYDQLNRLTKMDAYSGLNNATNIFTAVSTNNYKEIISYDANGNIQTYLRNGNIQDGSPLAMDNMTYHYKPNKNQLDHVTDAVPVSNYSIDIDNQSTLNYTYDQISNLTKDAAEGITAIKWNVYGKITDISKSDGTKINYTYDPAGNRISKTVNNKKSFCVRDASGNVMSVYTKDAGVNGGDLSRTETHLYGSSRLGMSTHISNVENPTATHSFVTGLMIYEGVNHLGNVLITFSDKKIAIPKPSPYSEEIDYYVADVVGANDYYPFGFQMPNRKYLQSNSTYRYGFNTQERSIEINDNSYTAEFWQYDSRVGKRWNTDPVILTGESPYLVNGGNPLYFTDPLGDFKTKFGAKWHKFWHGGDKIGQNKYGEWYVSSSKIDVKDNFQTTITIATTYGKGRNKYSTVIEEFEREDRIRNDILRHGGSFDETGKLISSGSSMYTIYDSPQEAGKAALSIGPGLLLPNPVLKIASVASNAGKGVGLTDDVASTFRFGKYSKTVLEQPMTLFRYYDDVNAFAPGRFMTNSVSRFKFLDRMTLAIRPKWNNMTKVAEWQFPVGSTLYKGKSSMQFPWFGGKTQYFVPPDVLKAATQIK